MKPKRQGGVLIVVLLAVLAFCAWMGYRDYTGAGSTDAKSAVASLRATVKKQTVNFTLMLTDKDGKKISSVRTARGKRAGPPKVEIRDPAGEAIYTFQMKYG